MVPEEFSTIIDVFNKLNIVPTKKVVKFAAYNH